ncbi:Chaperone protein TorD [Sporomusa silvacetica DSM 10669]|uniref:Chaperone protein TorD n=1 Tax=Sporomusa silvacetica DSM 10669 TaxID=1123289 RepID=A0ABZ3IH94_9FIRM|nr:molecular chaperone TorD family protein [Sporomusa silvacetica]OZC14893.1 Tat proofreading chaperone DmsD [Sporomusa silvacetica DSM 10669]
MFHHEQDDQCSNGLTTEDHETETIISLLPLLEARIFAYDFLRRIFLEEPSREFLVNLSQQQTVMAFPFKDENQDIAQGTQNVQAYIQQSNVLNETEYGKLHWDYTRLFIGPYELVAPPWESAYLNKDKLLFQEETRRVRLAYLKYAFLPVLYQQEADDHLGLECDFMYQLSIVAYEKAQAKDWIGLREVLQDQADFLEQHLLRWIPLFAEKVIFHSSTAFYQGMGQIVNGFSKMDKIVLDELLKIKH